MGLSIEKKRKKYILIIMASLGIIFVISMSVYLALGDIDNKKRKNLEKVNVFIVDGKKIICPYNHTLNVKTKACEEIK